MITPDTKVLLTITEKGTLKKVVYVKEQFKYPFFKKVKNQAMASLDGKQWYSLQEIKKIAPPTKLPAKVIEKYNIVKRQLVLSETAVQYYVSIEGKPVGLMSENSWINRTPEERLEANIKLTVSALSPNYESYKYEFIN